MKEKTLIKKNLACILLLLFVVGSLPKAHFHDLVADHVDMASCDQKHSEAVLHKQSVNCHFDDQVVTNPFVPISVQDYTAANLHFEKKVFVCFNSYRYSFVQHKESRGPPSLHCA